MERNPGRLIEQLQNVQIRQRKLIQQLQAENARRICDLADIRLERDAFRKEAARMRKENAELQGRLEQVWTEHQDLRRERATWMHSQLMTNHAHSRHSNLNLNIKNNLSVLNEEQTEATPTAKSNNMDKARYPELEPYLHSALLDSPTSGLSMPTAPPSRISGVQINSRGGESVTL